MATNDLNPADYNSSTREFELGSLIEMTHAGIRGTFRYVKVVDAACADGDVMELASTTTWDVTNDRAGGSSVGDIVVGVAVGTISQNQYGFILTHGIHDAVKTDGSSAADVSLVPHTTADGQAIAMTDPGNEEKVFGVGLAADSATPNSTGKVLVRVL